MKQIKFKLFQLFIVLLILLSCSEEKRNSVYTFTKLSTGRLVDLKKISEKIEGFFFTTHATSFFKDIQGTSFYVCIRFLNDPTVNQKLKKTALPLLIQVGHQKTAPLAETVILLHPENNGVFYYEESQFFQLPSMPLILKNKEYEIMDLHFGSTGKITQLYLKQKEISLKKISESRPKKPPNNSTSTQTPPVLKLSSFINLSSDSCKTWPVLRYTHSEEIPEYLKVHYSENQAPPTNPTPPNKGATSTTRSPQPQPQSQPQPTTHTQHPPLPVVPTQRPINEKAPYKPAPKTTN